MVLRLAKSIPDLLSSGGHFIWSNIAGLLKEIDDDYYHTPGNVRPGKSMNINVDESPIYTGIGYFN